jgi:secernin
MNQEVLPHLGPVPKGYYDPESLWWQHEKLHRIVLKDYSKLALYGADRNRLERSFLEKACLVKENDTMDMTYQAFDQSRRATRDWINLVESRPAKKSLKPLFNLYWKKQNKKAGLFPE